MQSFSISSFPINITPVMTTASSQHTVLKKTSDLEQTKIDKQLISILKKNKKQPKKNVTFSLPSYPIQVTKDKAIPIDHQVLKTLFNVLTTFNSKVYHSPKIANWQKKQIKIVCYYFKCLLSFQKRLKMLIKCEKLFSKETKDTLNQQRKTLTRFLALLPEKKVLKKIKLSMLLNQVGSKEINLMNELITLFLELYPHFPDISEMTLYKHTINISTLFSFLHEKTTPLWSTNASIVSQKEWLSSIKTIFLADDLHLDIITHIEKLLLELAHIRIKQQTIIQDILSKIQEHYCKRFFSYKMPIMLEQGRFTVRTSQDKLFVKGNIILYDRAKKSDIDDTIKNLYDSIQSLKFMSKYIIKDDLLQLMALQEQANEKTLFLYSSQKKLLAQVSFAKDDNNTIPLTKLYDFIHLAQSMIS